MRLILSFAAAMAFCSLPGQAAFTVISNPDAAYFASTTKLDFSGVANFATFTTVSDGVLTLTSSNALMKLQVPTSWGSWSAPPNAEAATPAVAYNLTQSDTLTLSAGVDTFGFEIEPNARGVHTVTADFFRGATLLGTVTRAVNSSSGARLVAASDTDIDKVVVSMSGGSFGFAFAQFRYTPSAVPEPGSVGLLSTVIVAVLVRKRIWRSV